jgi:hypothetical protein|tara:strand:+ start:968 stop:1219 length:252 start_codon:yes stop_codon:yes gene_type:complete
MSLVKETIEDRIEVIGKYKAVQVRTKTAITEDGVEISSGYSRKVISAGDDYSGESAEVQGVCAAVHSNEVVSAYAAYLETLED